MEEQLGRGRGGPADYIQLLHNLNYDGFEDAPKQAEIDLEGKRIKIMDEVTDVCEKVRPQYGHQVRPVRQVLARPGFPAPTIFADHRDTGLPGVRREGGQEDPRAAMRLTAAINNFHLSVHDLG